MGRNNLFSETKEAEIVMATANYIRNNYTSGNKIISDDEWLGPGKELNRHMIIMTAKGFQIRGSKWIFLKIKDMYIGLHDKGDKGFVAIAMLEKKNNNWVIFDYFLVNRYNSGWIPPHLRGKNKTSAKSGDGR